MQVETRAIYTPTMAKSDGVISGRSNTAIIIAVQGYGDGETYAARISNEYSVTQGYSPRVQRIILFG